MLKQVSVMKRHPDLTMDEFIRRYEGEHAKFGETLFRKAKRYVRRYVQPEKNFLTGEVAELDFDVIMEIWWESREDLVEAMKGIATSGLIDDVRRSGEGLFAPQKVPAFTVTEYDSDMGTHG
jgi:EthD domain